eukprot:CAMPEP_0114973030 /NCGR_PEP_ID=MMETSP0216-20121206/728_1 /TAXON_ID=223996 /ORGANISM="Protocruzia adherens, Strain Boccale" /LENGTH=447 /DNA_ID=CAMNT_0002333477 /DNA_START=433 /DNA_END=1776 /DNA_ORIENTATION=+
MKPAGTIGDLGEEAVYTPGVDASWMIIPKERVTLDGRSCNKIGVSFAAFQHESNKCSRNPGSCLNGQLKSLYKQDQQRRIDGLKTRYLLTANSKYRLTAGHKTTPSAPVLAYSNLQGAWSSLVTIEISADNLKYITTESPGEIVSARIEDFEAQSGEGNLKLQVKNTGTLTADYWIQVSCSQGIMNVLAERISLKSKEAQSFEFPIRATDEAAKEYQCECQLKSVTAFLWDTKIVTFKTTARQEDRPQQGGALNESGDGISTGDAEDNACERGCDFINIFCHVDCLSNWQSATFMTLFTIILLILFLGIIVKVIIPLAKCCFTSGKGKKEQDIRTEVIQRYVDEVPPSRKRFSHLYARDSTDIMFANITPSSDCGKFLNLHQPVSLECEIDREGVIKFAKEVELLDILAGSSILKSRRQLRSDLYGIAVKVPSMFSRDPRYESFPKP